MAKYGRRRRTLDTGGLLGGGNDSDDDGGDDSYNKLLPVSVTVDGVVRPPHTIISDPVHTAVCKVLPNGASVRGVGVHVSVDGLYIDPVSV